MHSKDCWDLQIRVALSKLLKREGIGRVGETGSPAHLTGGPSHFDGIAICRSSNA